MSSLTQKTLSRGIFVRQRCNSQEVTEPGDVIALEGRRAKAGEFCASGELNKLFKHIASVQLAGTSIDAQIAKILKYFFTSS